MPFIVPLDREPDKGETPAGQHRGLDRRSLNCMYSVAQFQTRTFGVAVLCGVRACLFSEVLCRRWAWLSAAFSHTCSASDHQRQFILK